MSFLGKCNRTLVHLLFPFVERFYLFLPIIVLIAFWSIPDTLWPVRLVLIWLWFLSNEIHWEGVAERDFLLMQVETSLFYRIYRVIDETAFLFLFLCLIIMLIPGPPLQKYQVLGGLFFLTLVVRGIGDRKYRPKKPEE